MLIIIRLKITNYRGRGYLHKINIDFKGRERSTGKQGIKSPAKTSIKNKLICQTGSTGFMTAANRAKDELTKRGLINANPKN